MKQKKTEEPMAVSMEDLKKIRDLIRKMGKAGFLSLVELFKK